MGEASPSRVVVQALGGAEAPENRQAAAVAHVAAHVLGAAFSATTPHLLPRPTAESLGASDAEWQRDLLPEAIHRLVLDEQRLRQRHLLVGVSSDY